MSHENNEMGVYDVLINDETKTVRGTCKRYDFGPQGTVADLKAKLGQVEGFQRDRYRLYFKNGDHEECVDDDEILEDIAKNGGNFVAEISKLSSPFEKCKVNITCDETDCVGEVGILIGTPKKFEHFLLTRRSNNFKLTRGILSSH